jgi:hypothetical protein
MLETIAATIGAPLKWLMSKLTAALGDKAGIKVGHDVIGQNVAGRDINIHVGERRSPKSIVLDGWEDQPGAPEFKISPGSSGAPDHVRADLSFHQINDTPVGKLRGRFRGPGVETDFVKPMVENRARHFQMKSVDVSPTEQPDADLGDATAGFELSFNWEGAERHILWVADIERLDRGIWTLNWKGEPHKLWSVESGT